MISEQLQKEEETKNVESRPKKKGFLSSLRVPGLLRKLKSERIEREDDTATDNDLIYQGKVVDLRKIPFAREMFLKKKDTILGNRFRKTLMGYTKGAVSQYRGPYSTHVREYSDHYTIHRDFIDPRKNPISHLAKDAPMELAAWVVGGLIALLIILFLIF